MAEQTAVSDALNPNPFADALAPVSTITNNDNLAPISKDTVKIDDQDMYLYDGDTLIHKDTKESYYLPSFLRGDRSSIRLLGYDAAEVSRMGKEGYKLGQVAGDVQRREINNIIKKLNFNKTVDGGKRDKFGRRLSDLVNPQGVKLSDYLHSERVVSANRWMSSQHEMLRTFGSLADSVNNIGNSVSPGDKARVIVQQVMGPAVQRDIFGAPEDVLKGSGLSVKLYQSSINSLNRRVEKEKDPTKLAILKDELLRTKEALTVAINEPPGALFVRKQANQFKGDPGFWGEMWNSGEKSLYMLENTAAGFTAWTGDLINSEALQEMGDEWVTDTENDLMGAGFTTDMWSVRNPLDATRFVANTIIQYGPQLGIIWGASKTGALVGGAPGALIGGTGAAFVMAVSSVYQGQPEGEKDPLVAAGIALPIAIIDKLGADVALPSGVNLFTKEGRDLVSEAIQKKYKGELSDTELQEILNRTTLEILDEAGISLKRAAIDQLLAKRTFGDLVSTLSRRAGTEGATEALQEVIQDVGIAGTTSKEMDYQNLLYNALESGTIGAIVGGTFATPGIYKEHIRLNKAFYNITSEDPEQRTRDSKLEEFMRERWNKKDEQGRALKMSDVEVAQHYKDKTKKRAPTGLGRIASFAPKKTRYSDLISLIKNPVRAVQAYRGFANEKIFNPDGTFNKHVADLAALINGVRLYTGVSAPADQRKLTANFFYDIPGKQEIMQKLRVNRIEDVYQLLNTPENALNPAIREEVIELKAKLAEMGTNIWQTISERRLEEDIKVSQEDLTSGNIFLRPNMIDPSKVDERFRELLKNSEGYVEEDPLASNQGRTTFDDETLDRIFSGIESGYLSDADRGRLEDAGVFDINNSSFSPYISMNMFDNAIRYADSIAKDIALSSKFGRRGEVISQILDDAERAGEINKEEKAELAAMTLDLLDMMKGKYRPITNKRFKWVQENLLFASTLTYMDLNFFANMVEYVNGLIGLDSKQMYAYIKDSSAIFFKGLNKDINAGTNLATKKVLNKPIGSATPKRRDEDLRISRLVATGIVGPKSDIAYLEGANTSSKFYSTLTTVFYKLNLVENQTMSMRGARAAAAWGTMIKMVTILKQDKDLGYTTEAGRYARDRLNYYRVDADMLINIVEDLDKRDIKMNESFILDQDTIDQVLGPVNARKLYDQYVNGVTNFTDEFSVRPEPGSSPRIIEDPNLRLFTQFKRFIAHFTANVVPQAWQMYVKRGEPGMNYSVFAIILGAYGMAMFSQMMKDYITYGEKAPWLEDDEEEPYWLRTTYWRAASYTGWMGTPSMLIEAIGDYDKNAARMNIFESFYDATVSQSPALNLINDQIRKGTEDVPERVAKLTPFVGGIGPAREKLAELLGKE